MSLTISVHACSAVTRPMPARQIRAVAILRLAILVTSTVRQSRSRRLPAGSVASSGRGLPSPSPNEIEPLCLAGLPNEKLIRLHSKRCPRLGVTLVPNAAFCEIRHGPLSYGLWHARRQRVEKIHQWQQWLSRVSEVVQWDNQRARLAGVARSEVVPDQHDYEAISNR